MSQPMVISDGECFVLFPDECVTYLIGAQGARIRALRERAGVTIDPLNVTEEGAVRRVGTASTLYRRVYIGAIGTERRNPKALDPAGLERATRLLVECLDAWWAEKTGRGVPGQQVAAPLQQQQGADVLAGTAAMIHYVQQQLLQSQAALVQQQRALGYGPGVEQQTQPLLQLQMQRMGQQLVEMQLLTEHMQTQVQTMSTGGEQQPPPYPQQQQYQQQYPQPLEQQYQQQYPQPQQQLQPQQWQLQPQPHKKPRQSQLPAIQLLDDTPLSFWMPEGLVQSLIGPKGERVNALRARCQCEIMVLEQKDGIPGRVDHAIVYGSETFRRVYVGRKGSKLFELIQGAAKAQLTPAELICAKQFIYESLADARHGHAKWAENAAGRAAALLQQHQQQPPPQPQPQQPQPQWAALPTPSPGTGQQGTPTPQPLALSQPLDPTATAGQKELSAVAGTPGIPDIPDLPDNHPRVATMRAMFNATPPTAKESLVVYCSRLTSTPQEHLARPIVQLQQMGMIDMFEFSFTDVKIVLLSLGPKS